MISGAGHLVVVVEEGMFYPVGLRAGTLAPCIYYIGVHFFFFCY